MKYKKIKNTFKKVLKLVARLRSKGQRRKNWTRITNSYLPEEVVFTILSYLPVTSLLRFTCVCKSWESMILHPHFIQTHLTNSQNKPILLAINYTVRGSLIMPNRHMHPTFSQDIVNLNLQLKSLITPMEFLGSYNGILCLRYCYNINCLIYLLNPLTRQYMGLPYPTISKNPILSKVKDIVGFGFDCISNDYKVVRIVCGYGSDDYLVLNDIQAELYSTNAASWRQIQLPDSIKASTFQGDFQLKYGFVLKGVLYSMAYDEIVWVDLYNEVFGLVPIPCLKPTENKSKLFYFEGSLAFMSTSTVVGDGTITSLWTLDDVCGIASWTKKFNFEHGLRKTSECVYLEDGQLVLYDYDRSILYDYKNKKTKELQSLSDQWDPVHVKYSKSLVSIQGFRPFSNL